jgi:hypothetical protein
MSVENEIEVIKEDIRLIRKRLQYLLSTSGGYVDGPLWYTGDLQPHRTLVQYTGYVYVPLENAVAGWNPNTNQSVGAVDLQSAPWSLPADIKAVNVRMSYQAANNNDWGGLRRDSGDDLMLIARCPDANEFGDEAAVVNCDGNGDVYFDTNNTTNTVYMFIVGYFL